MQVEDLTCKSQRLEAELQKALKKLNEVSAVATYEAEKSKSAKEVIKSLTAQVCKMFFLHYFVFFYILEKYYWHLCLIN